MISRIRTNSDFYRITVEGMRLLVPRERRLAMVLSILVALVEAIQIAAVILMLPLVGLIVEPGLLDRSKILQRLHAALGGLSVEDFVLVLGLGALALHVAAQASSFLIHAAIEVFTARTQARLARELLAETIAAPYPWFLDRNAAAIVRLFHNDIAMWGRDFVGNLLRILANVLTILGGGAVVLAAAPVGGVVILAAVGIVAYGVMRWVRPHLVEWTEIKRLAAEETMVTETQIFSGVKDIKISGVEMYFVGLFGSLYGSMSRASARCVIFGQVPISILLLLGQSGLLTLMVALWLSGSRGGTLASQMALIALVTYRVVPVVTQLSQLLTSLVRVIPWVKGILDLQNGIRDAREAFSRRAPGCRPVPSGWREIHFAQVGFTYAAGRRPVLQDLSVSLDRGRVYALIGPSGAGKSTLIDLLLGLLRPSAGEILIDDVPLREIDLREWQRRIGYVAQSPYFIDATIRANVAFGVQDHEVEEERVRRCIDMAGLRELVGALPRGLDTPLGDRAVKISGGERQRIAIARALYREPEFLVLDEATSALDPPNQQLINRTIERLRGQLTTLIVSHHMSAVSCSDRVFLLDEGRLVATGSLDEVVLAHPSFGESLGQRA